MQNYIENHCNSKFKVNMLLVIFPKAQNIDKGHLLPCLLGCWAWPSSAASRRCACAGDSPTLGRICGA